MWNIINNCKIFIIHIYSNWSYLYTAHFKLKRYQSVKHIYEGVYYNFSLSLFYSLLLFPQFRWKPELRKCRFCCRLFVCLYVCLSVCLSVCEHSTGRNFAAGIFKFCTYNLYGMRKTPIENGVRRPSGKGSKVTKFIFFLYNLI